MTRPALQKMNLDRAQISAALKNNGMKTTGWTDEHGSHKWVIAVEWVRGRGLEDWRATADGSLAGIGRKTTGVRDKDGGGRAGGRWWLAEAKRSWEWKCLPAVLHKQLSCFKVTQERWVALDWSKENTFTDNEPLVVQKTRLVMTHEVIFQQHSSRQRRSNPPTPPFI